MAPHSELSTRKPPAPEAQEAVLTSPREDEPEKETSGALSWRERAKALFPEDPPRPGRSRLGWWVLLAVLAGAVLSLLRETRGAGVFNSIWAEDGSFFLTEALTHNEFRMILRPINGYFLMVPRALTIPASWMPIEWAPATLAIEAALVTALMAVGVWFASRQYLRNPLARLIAAAPVIAVPVGENVASATANNVATLQFAAVYVAMWMVLWVPQRRSMQIVSALAVFAVAVSTFLAIILLPLALLRLYGRRDLISWAMVGGLLASLAANLFVLAIGRTARPVMLPSRWEPGWAFENVAGWALPHAMFGFGITGNGDQLIHPPWLAQASWILLGVAVLLAALRLTRPHWPLAALMLLTGFAFIWVIIMQYGGLELRYVIAPELMLFAALAALLLPRRDLPRWKAWAPITVLFVGVALVLGFSYSAKTQDFQKLAAWDEAVSRARVVCQEPVVDAIQISISDGAVIRIIDGKFVGTPGYFPVTIPCDRLR